MAISERDVRFLSGDKSLDPSEPQVPLRGGYPICQTKPTLLLHEGDRIGSLEVIATPGHTPGHIAFLDTRDRTVYRWRCVPDAGRCCRFWHIRNTLPLPSARYLAQRFSLESARRLLGAPTISVSGRSWSRAQSSSGGDGACHSCHGAGSC